MIPLSVLDLAPIAQGSDAAQSFRNTLSLAQLAERCGFKRYWLAEHHGMPGISSAATSVLMAHVAGGTRSGLAVGHGGQSLCLRAAVVHGDLPAGLRERQGHFAAEAAGGACDEDGGRGVHGLRYSRATIPV